MKTIINILTEYYGETSDLELFVLVVCFVAIASLTVLLVQIVHDALQPSFNSLMEKVSE